MIYKDFNFGWIRFNLTQGHTNDSLDTLSLSGLFFGIKFPLCLNGSFKLV